MGRLNLNYNEIPFRYCSPCLSQVQAVEVSTEAEWGNSYGGYGGYGSYGTAAYSTVRRVYKPTVHYNGHGPHSYSSHSSSDYTSYSSDDYSSSDYGYGYRSYGGRHRHYRYRPRYSSGRYYYGKRYASHGGHYKGSYRTLGYRSYNACYGGCTRPSTYKW